jgi:uncharacterized protein (TIGR02246 family)
MNRFKGLACKERTGWGRLRLTIPAEIEESLVGKAITVGGLPVRRAFAAVGLLLTILPFVTGQTMDDKRVRIGRERDQDAIKKVVADFVGAWNKHDAKAFSLTFAEDADFTNVRGISAHGRTEIEKFHAPRFATTFKDTHLTITKVEIRFVRPDVASVDALWEMTGARIPDGTQIALRKGLSNFVITNENERWFIIVMHNMELPVSQ